MDDLRLPFKIRWAGEPMPDVADFSQPLAIPFWLRPAADPPNPDTQETAGNRPNSDT